MSLRQKVAQIKGAAVPGNGPERAAAPVSGLRMRSHERVTAASSLLLLLLKNDGVVEGRTMLLPPLRRRRRGDGDR